MEKSIDTDPVRARRAEGLKILQGVIDYMQRDGGKGESALERYHGAIKTFGPAIVWCMRSIAADVDGAECCRLLEMHGVPAEKARKVWRNILKMQAVVLWYTSPEWIALLFPPAPLDYMDATRREFPYWRGPAVLLAWIRALRNPDMQGFCTALDRAGVSLDEWAGGCSMQP